MTEHPHAKPTPWTALPYDSDWECVRVVDPLHGICDVFGEPRTATARAKLFAAAPETAAERDRLRQTVIDAEKRCIELLQERDRLVKVNEELIEALDALVSGQHYHFSGCSCPWCEARTTLTKARK